MKNHVDILCYYDQYHHCLYDHIFYPSFKDNLCQKTFSMKPKIIQSKETNDISFLSNHWSNILIDRYDYLIDYSNKNTNSWAIFSDIDIVFLSDISSSINTIIEKNNKKNIHISYMKEIPFIDRKLDANGGFVLFKCCDAVINYFRQIQDMCREMQQPNDQDCINKLLNTDIINHQLLPKIEYLTNNGSPQLSKKYVQSNKVKVFHATSAPSLICKLQVLGSAIHYSSPSKNKHFNSW